jgi:hypothetical protein
MRGRFTFYINSCTAIFHRIISGMLIFLQGTQPTFYHILIVNDITGDDNDAFMRQFTRCYLKTDCL